jgi:hypothetical protein
MDETEVLTEAPSATPSSTTSPVDSLQDPLTLPTQATSGGSSGSPNGSFKDKLNDVVKKSANGGSQDVLASSTLSDQVGSQGGTTTGDTQQKPTVEPKVEAPVDPEALAKLQSPGAVEVDDQTIDDSELTDNDRAEGEKLVPKSNYSDAKQQQAYTYMLWVAEYEQKESLVHFFEKQTQGLREKVLAEGVKSDLLPTKKTPAQEEAEEKKKAQEAEAKRKKELEEREAKAKQNKGFWGWIKNAAATVGNGIADAASWVGNKVVDGAKAVGNGIVNAVGRIGKAIGYEKIDWAKLSSLMRTMIRDEKSGNKATGPKDDPSKALDYMNYAKLGGTAVAKGGEKIADLQSGKVDGESFLSATRIKDGVDTGSKAQQTTLGFNVAGSGVGLLGDALSGIDAGKRLANKDSDGVGDASAGLDLAKTGASMSNNIVNLVKASGDLAGKSGAVMSAAQLGLALGIGQIVGGTAELVKGILNTVDGASGLKRMNALRAKMESLKDVVEPKMYASVMQALDVAHAQVLSGVSDIITGAAGIVGGALLIALGVSNPIGLIVIGAAGIVGGVIAAYKWKKKQDSMRKLVDNHPAFKEKIGALSNKYRGAKEQEEKRGKDAKPDPFVKYIDDHAGVGDSVKGKLTGGEDNDGPKEAIRRIVLQEHGFVDVQDYQTFHNETLGQYLYAVLQKGEPSTVDPAIKSEVEAAASVVSTLGIKPTWQEGKGLVKPTKWEAIAGKM